MPLYEHVYLARQDLSAQQVEEMTATYKGVIEGLGGKLVVDPEYWGVKTLSFRIRKNRKAHFTMLRLDAPPAALTEIERQQRLSEDVLRYLTIRVDEHEEGPSAMMRKVDRDRERDERRGDRFDSFDRGDRGDRGPRGMVIAADAAAKRAATKPLRRRSKHHAVRIISRAPPLLPPPQDLPVHRRQRAEDRLQGREAVAALRLGARQDRAEPHHRGLDQEAA